MGYVDGLSMAAYVAGGVLNWVDPFGQQGTPFDHRPMKITPPPPPPPARDINDWAPKAGERPSPGTPGSLHNCGGWITGELLNRTNRWALDALSGRGCRPMSSCADMCECGVKCIYVRTTDYLHAPGSATPFAEVPNYHVACAKTDSDGKPMPCSAKNASGPVYDTDLDTELENWTGGAPAGSKKAVKTKRKIPGMTRPHDVYTRPIQVICYCCQ